MAGYPILLDLGGRRVVVVGGGRIAERRVADLVQAGADVVVVAPQVGSGLHAWAASGAVRVTPRSYEPGDLAGAWLVMAATDDADTNARVGADAAAAGVFCVRVDDAATGSARVPAVARSGAFTVAVNAGDDPRRAAALRQAIAVALDTGTLSARPHRPPARGSVALVGGGPGAPDLITVRGLRLVNQADVVVVDRLAPRELLDGLAPEVEIVDCGKAAHRHNLTQEQINEVLVERAVRGRRVARLKGGDPYVFGRGGEEVAVCVAAGIDVEVVPGVSSALAAPALAGIPLTHRGVAADFAVVSGHLDPGRPRGGGLDWPALATGPDTLVLLMAMDRLSEIAATLVAHGRPAGTPAAVVQSASMAAQRVVRAPLGELGERAAAAGLGAPAVVIIGAVAALGEPGSRADSVPK